MSSEAVGYLMTACRELADSSPPLSRQCGKRLLRLIGRSMPKGKKQAAAEAALRSVCGGCGGYLLPHRNCTFSLAAGPAAPPPLQEPGPPSPGGKKPRTVDLTRGIDPSHVQSVYHLDCHYCRCRTTAAHCLSRVKPKTPPPPPPVKRPLQEDQQKQKKQPPLKQRKKADAKPQAKQASFRDFLGSLS
ncbi:hypothetical protein DIPPA_05937 [Diplonema papillatum]|nr:hypothetical protein DIPPA_05937 [Diplonema papillatum]